MIGSTISHYRIVAQIGAGGMGIVYEAEDLILKRRVAIKTLKDSNSKVARLLREARAVSRIAHPNIATIYDYGETEEGRPFIVMELVNGKRFDEWVRENHPDLLQVVEVIIKVTEGVSAAHRGNIIHRDIKPSNILIDRNGQVKVLDFGLSKQLQTFADDSVDGSDLTQTQDGMVIGTPLYLSPEQATCEKADERSDIFSLGTLFYEAITGKSPFYSESVFETCAKILRDDPPQPSEVNPAIPGSFDCVTQKAMAKNPADRYQTAAELLADLKALQNDSMDVVVKVPERRPAAAGLSISQRLRTSFKDVLRYRYLMVLAFVLTAFAGVALFLLWENKAGYPANPEAQKWYEKGETAFNDGLFFAARNCFEKAVEVDANFVLAYARYAEVLDQLGYIEQARQERERANNLVLSSQTTLSAVDKFRLQAINDTLLSNFDSAVDDYKKMVDYVSQAAKPQALMDLARAYERVQNQDEAIKTYQKALEYDSNLPAANVRLAVLHGRRLENETSTAYFDKAEELYKIQNNPEGEIEVSYQRGLLISSIGDASLARDETEKALRKAEINEIHYQHVKCLLLMSRVLRFSSKSNDALTYIEKAIPLSLQNNLGDLHARSLLELGTVYLFLDKRDQARTTYEEALVAARKYNIAVTENRVLMQLGALSLVEHDHQKVLGYVDQVRGFFEQGGYKKDMLDLLSIEAQAVTLKGDQKKALSIYTDLLARAEDAEDVVIKARAQKGLGTILANMDEFTRALPQIYQSYSLNNSIHKTLEAGYALVLYADVLAQLGRYDETDTALKQAEGLAQTNSALTRRINLVRAKRVLSEGNFEAAIQICTTMMESDPKLNSPSNLEAQSVLALAYARSGERSKAERAIGEINLGSRKIEEKEVRGKIYLIRAEIMLGGGKNDIALDDAIQAQTIFKELDKPSFEWQAWTLLSKAQTRLNQLDTAKVSLGNAGVIFSTLAQKWGEDFKTYSQRADLKAYRD